MSPLTLRSYVDALEALVPASVTRRFTQGPPASLTTADCPAQWIQPPMSYRDGPFTFGEQGGWPTLSVTMVIAVGPVAQDTPGNNFDDTVDMADNLTTAIRDEGLTSSLCGLSWNIVVTIVPVAGFDFWAVVCTVEGTSQTT